MIATDNSFRSHIRIIGALMMRETVTRYGRQGLGLLWLIGEPLLFCFGVIIMWSLIKPAYEHGVRIAPFIMTGYMCLLLLRHLVGANMNALQANGGSAGQITGPIAVPGTTGVPMRVVAVVLIVILSPRH